MIRVFTLLLILASLGWSCSPKPLLVSLDKSAVRDVVIHKSIGFGGPCEPSICINPMNPKIIVAASVLNNIYRSSNGGATWDKAKLESPYGVYGDPVVRYNNSGMVYYAHLSNPDNAAYVAASFLDRIVVQKSDDNGHTWDEGGFPPGDTLKDHDKQWMAVDPNTDEVLMAWTEFDKYGSKDEAHRSRILFSKCAGRENRWSAPIVISQLEGDCIDDDQTTEGCTPAIGINGEYFLAWSFDENIYFDRSLDGGLSWLENDIVAVDQPGGWSYEVPGLGRCNGMPILEVDHSRGPHRGTIYINWTDQRNGKDNTDVWIIKSKDQGQTWTKPIRINDDQSKKHQFLTWMDVDPITGVIYTVFYDRRDHMDETTDVYLAYSSDGAETWTNIRINENSFKNKAGVFFGDYNDISAYDGVVRPIWTQQDGIQLSVHTALLNFKTNQK